MPVRIAFTTTRNDSTLADGVRLGNLYRIRRAAHRETRHYKRRNRLQSDLSTRHRFPLPGSRPSIHGDTRVHIHRDIHRDHEQMLY